MEVIISQNVFHLYNNERGVRDISLSVNSGTSFGILGSNGSGKTTLTRLIAGLDKIQKGTLSVFGKPAFKKTTVLRFRCGISLDKPAHWEALTGRQNLDFFARQYGLSGSKLKQRIDTLLEEAEILKQANDPVSAYSFGMRRKLSIIEALVHEPDLLILDEPSAGVDVSFLDKLAYWIKERNTEGNTTWISDNDPDWIARAATEVVLLDNGTIKAAGIVSELMNSVKAINRINVTVERVDTSNIPDIRGIEQFKCDGNRIIADILDDSNLTTELLGWINKNGMRIQTMQVKSLTLHEALMKKSELEEVKL